MARDKFKVGEAVEMRCLHRREGQLVLDWLNGVVAEADYRMLGVRFETMVYANTGQPIADRTLWCTHGSPNLRRPGERDRADLTREVTAND